MTCWETVVLSEAWLALQNPPPRSGGRGHEARRYGPGRPEEHSSMTHRRRPEDEAVPQQCDASYRLRAIERWLHHADEELLYAPDAAEEAAATSLDARYYLRW